MTFDKFLNLAEEAIKERETEINEMLRKGLGGDTAHQAWNIIQELKIVVRKTRKLLED